MKDMVKVKPCCVSTADSEDILAFDWHICVLNLIMGIICYMEAVLFPCKHDSKSIKSFYIFSSFPGNLSWYVFKLCSLSFSFWTLSGVRIWQDSVHICWCYLMSSKSNQMFTFTAVCFTNIWGKETPDTQWSETYKASTSHNPDGISFSISIFTKPGQGFIPLPDTRI